MNCDEVKKKIRQEMKKALSDLPRKKHERQSLEVAEHLFSLNIWKQAKVIGITIAIHPEISTRPIIERAWKEGKEVAVPKCFPQHRSMEFKRIHSFAELEQVYSGLLEPVDGTVKAEKDEIDLLIVPGLAFTVDGYRLGFGGGYYDRFLTGFNASTAALAFDLQLVDQLPLESHDIPVNHILTPNRLFNRSHS
ncbi:5-formyltetrahydrofolate cyclo-ligase [Bacillus massiliglaciei]|uniref:5-formyltetrahydrofolate cyclo-ligase n=1 Tax=Bacillus massiliglaciei TaxID=1816693 RepID=UPI000B1ED018|nr:5-formyltetrahydrofolate cyclo-ligase [Bacillus massiliglaciei]